MSDAGNPCPFLRALVALGALNGRTDALSTVTRVVSRAFPRDRAVLRPAICGIAWIANGLGPASLVRTVRSGVRFDALRGGPLDKRGAGSRILDGSGALVPAELDRLATFAVDKTADGATERGLGEPELRAMMDANYTRAAGHRRWIDRKLMNGEWPVLLRVMGKAGVDGSYLAVDEVRALFADERLPDRVVARLRGSP